MLQQAYERAYSRSYFHRPQPIGRHFTPGSLGGYYNDLTGKADYDGPHDAIGAPLVALPGGQAVAHPIATAQMALGLHERWLATGDPADRSRFLRLAHSLLAAGKPAPHGVVWHFPFPIDLYFRLPAPWISAMAQGEAISVLVRAHALTGQTEFLRTARDAARPLAVDVAAGGLGRMTEHGWWLEEYPTAPASRVLNGCIFAAWGLYDLGLAGDEAAASQFRAVSRTIAASLPAFDIAAWSRYDLYPFALPNLASPFYHHLHVAQLDAMWRLTGDERFAHFRDRWRHAGTNAARASAAIAYKAAYRMARVVPQRARHAAGRARAVAARNARSAAPGPPGGRSA